MRVEIYSDVVCPWCYIGERRFARALAAFPQGEAVEVVYRPYQLDPGAASAPAPLLGALERKFGARARGMVQHVTATAKAEGIDIAWEDAVSANTLTAHRLMWLAEREYGAATQRVLAEKLFEAHFTRGGDVGDRGLLAELAAACGMDAERVGAYLASDEGVAETRRAIAEAQQLGVRAVPTFVLDGKYVVEGAQPMSTFLRVLEEVAARSGAPEGDAGDDAADASCADGRCAV